MNKKIQTLSFSAIFAALVFVGTYFAKIPINPTGGYVHIGDAFIFLAAVLLPLPYAMGAAAIGAGLADIIGGYAIWSPWTFFIKALMVLAFVLVYRKNDNLIFKIIALISGAIVSLGGYYLAEFVIYGNPWVPFAVSMPLNVLQATASSIVFILLLPIVKRLIGKYYITK